MAPPVLVLVLNYNAGFALEKCLRSLQSTAYPNARIVVLDNGSSDGSAEIPERMDLETHRYGENLGYCEAYNRAFRTFGDADWLLLSNPDVEVPPPTIGQMVTAALSDASIGFVGPVQLNAATGEVRSAGMRWRCGRMPRHVRRTGRSYDYVEGAFLLVRRSVMDNVGGLNEDLALNLEDVDWQHRARAAGFRSVVAQDAFIHHLPPGPQRVATGAYYQTRNACIVTERFCGSTPLALLRLRLYLEGLAGRALGRPRGPFILEGLRDFERGVRGIREFPSSERG